ncbi:MAG: hypothetical protein LBN37_07380 [Bacteroidales bacterium]|nr:hypothetical protein [Bacteroidales bacterium]
MEASPFHLHFRGEKSVELKTDWNTLVDRVGLAASDVLIKAINNSIASAESIDGFPSYKEVTGS